MKQLSPLFLFLFFIFDASGQGAIPAIDADLLEQLSTDNSQADSEISSSYDSFSKKAISSKR